MKDKENKNAIKRTVTEELIEIIFVMKFCFYKRIKKNKRQKEDKL